ncbi:MAG: CDP-alcohol phosphatidyltransferase family protein [Oscillospiraceae bacterium]|nr:CDP-alcohol phosphatidyltransferase family protein [Oscillospiraceae bacterium]
MIGFYNYTVILTYLGMLSGFAGIACAFGGNLRSALICLVIAGVCDMFDGKIASTMERTRQEKRFGIQIDSLSDLVCFGVLPAMLVYANGGGKLRWLPSALYLLCVLIRLAWFNVDEEERQDREGGRRKVYLGLPVTTAAVIFPLLFGLGRKYNWPLQLLAPFVLLFTATAFLTPFRIMKPALPEKHETLLRDLDEPETDRLAEAK